MPHELIPEVYCDGGLVGPNPSPLGGVWAYCWVDSNGVRIHQASGLVEPEDLGVESITNNDMELLAALRVLKSLPPDWRGFLCTDSSVTISRLGRGEANAVIPWMGEVLQRFRRVDRGYHLRLLAGHATRKELNRGYRLKNKLPTSFHNQWCDEACNKAKLILTSRVS